MFLISDDRALTKSAGTKFYPQHNYIMLRNFENGLIPFFYQRMQIGIKWHSLKVKSAYRSRVLFTDKKCWSMISLSRKWPMVTKRDNVSWEIVNLISVSDIFRESTTWLCTILHFFSSFSFFLCRIYTFLSSSFILSCYFICIVSLVT